MFRKTSVRRLVLSIAVLIPVAGLLLASDWDEPGKKWIKGPVSYLVTDAEEKEFKKAGANGWEAFIQEFWARRDPHPDTDGNPFRDRFYARVESADAIMKAQGVPAGWKSEPAKVLILLGQPASVETGAASGSEGPGSGSGAGPSRNPGGTPSQTGGDAGGGTLTFTYPDPSALGLPENLAVTFQQEGLAYRLQTRVDLATPAIRGLDVEALALEFPKDMDPVEEKMTFTPQAPPAAGGVAALGGLGMQTELLTSLLDEKTSRDDLPTDVAIDLYKAKGEKTYVAITVGYSPSALAELGLDGGDLHPIAALRDSEAPDDLERLFLYDSDDLFAPSEDGGADEMLRFQAGDGVPPGMYTLVAGFVTSDGEKVGTAVQEIEVPDFGEAGVKLSSLTLATLLENTEEGGGELKRPYVLGNRKVIPRVTTHYPLNATLTVYYQVYNAEEQGGNPNLRISYNFYQKRGSRYVKAGTAPPADGVTDRVVIYELPLEGWPKGSYKIKVTVTDNVNGSFAEREIPFDVG